MQKTIQLTAIGLALFAAIGAQAQSKSEAQGALKSIVAHAKSKGIAKAAEDLTAGTDASKCKDIAGIQCYIISGDATMIGNAKNAKAVGTQFPPDMTDVDGNPMVDQIVSPLNKGKANWESKYKFALPGTKKIALQHAYCEKLDAKTAACAVVLNAQD